MLIRPLSLALAVSLCAATVAAVAQDAAADSKPREAAAAEPAPAAPPAYFPGLLKEGERLPDAATLRAQQKAERDRAGFDAALKESMNIAIRLGSFAMKLVIAIATAGLIGFSIAAVVTLVRGRHQQLMDGKVRASRD